VSVSLLACWKNFDRDGNATPLRSALPYVRSWHEAAVLGRPLIGRDWGQSGQHLQSDCGVTGGNWPLLGHSLFCF
jgi:hypothetical protein